MQRSAGAALQAGGGGGGGSGIYKEGCERNDRKRNLLNSETPPSTENRAAR